MKTKAIVTTPPYAPYLDEVLAHPFVSGIRLNTVMPLKESYEDALKRLDEAAKKYGKDFWVDLKCRQLRVAAYGVPPFTEVTLSHKISVHTPCKAYFSDRSQASTVLEVDGNRLIMQEGPRRVIGPGESVSIPHPTLEVEGYLTDTDKRYIEAGSKAGIEKFMLSFVEHSSDVEEFRKYNKTADLVAKIESPRGLDYVRNFWKGEARLMAARGDLYMELHWPHTLVEATETILRKDPGAIVASRIFDSLADFPEPSCAEVGDTDNLLRMGYRNFMFGDEVCLKREPIIGAVNLLRVMAERYD